MNNFAVNSVDQYRKLDVQTSVATASSHQLIGLLFDGARDRLNQARGYMAREDHAAKSRAINSVVDIVSGLQASLDHDAGGDLAANLDALYDYMQRRLFRANSDNDLHALNEIDDLVNTLRVAWSAMNVEEIDSAS